MKFLALAFAGAVICCAGSVRAESVYSQCCGPLYYHVHHDGTITGDYPKQSGQIYGSVSADDTARGIWTQPRSDHPCSHPRGGSYAWGRFVICEWAAQACRASGAIAIKFPIRTGVSTDRARN